MKLTLWLAGLSYLYLICLFVWALFYGLFGDRWSWLFLANSFALYLFLPLPLVVLAAGLAEQPRVLVGAAAGVLLWGYLYGGMFVPKPAPAHISDTGLTVMTSNVLGYREEPEQAITALRASDVDVIALQELNPTIATAIQHELAREYPYQQLEAHAGDSGMGVLSRFPLRALDVELPGVWIGNPQALLVEVRGVSVVLVNMHTMSPRFSNMEWTIRERERQAIVLADFVASRPEPAIVVGDFNAGDLSRAYRTMSGTLRDAWREAGWGLGHTFPGADSPSSSRRIVNGVLAPMWLVRIDYIFYSDTLRAEWAQVGPWDGVSDHRPVRAWLAPRVRSGIYDFR